MINLQAKLIPNTCCSNKRKDSEKPFNLQSLFLPLIRESKQLDPRL